MCFDRFWPPFDLFGQIHRWNSESRSMSLRQRLTMAWWYAQCARMKFLRAYPICWRSATRSAHVTWVKFRTFVLLRTYEVLKGIPPSGIVYRLESALRHCKFCKSSWIFSQMGTSHLPRWVLIPSALLGNIDAVHKQESCQVYKPISYWFTRKYRNIIALVYYWLMAA